MSFTNYINDQWNNPAVRYPFLMGATSLAIISSATSLPIIAACGISFGISLFASLGVQVGLYLKGLGDEAKNAITEVKKSVTNLEETMKGNFTFDVKKGEKPIAAVLKETLAQYKTMAKMLEDNLKIEGKPMITVLNETLVEFKTMAQTVEKNLQFDETKGEVSLAKGVKKTLAGVDTTISKINPHLEEAPEGQPPTLVQEVRKAVQNVDQTVENGRSGWLGWAIGLSGQKKAAENIAGPVPSTSVANDEEQVDQDVVNDLLGSLDSPPPSTRKTRGRKKGARL